MAEIRCKKLRVKTGDDPFSPLVWFDHATDSFWVEAPKNGQLAIKDSAIEGEAYVSCNLSVNRSAETVRVAAKHMPDYSKNEHFSLLAKFIDYRDGQWHGWNGGKCPVDPGDEVEIALDTGNPEKRITLGIGEAHRFGSRWEFAIAFRVVSRKPREYTDDDGVTWRQVTE